MIKNDYKILVLTLLISIPMQLFVLFGIDLMGGVTTFWQDFLIGIVSTFFVYGVLYFKGKQGETKQRQQKMIAGERNTMLTLKDGTKIIGAEAMHEHIEKIKRGWDSGITEHQRNLNEVIKKKRND